MCVNAKDVILHLHTLVPQHYLERDATHNEQKTSNNHMAETIDIRLLNAQIEAETGFITDLVEGMNRTIVGQKHLVNSSLMVTYYSKVCQVWPRRWPSRHWPR